MPHRGEGHRPQVPVRTRHAPGTPATSRPPGTRPAGRVDPTGRRQQSTPRCRTESLVFALQVLPVQPGIAAARVLVLATLQGTSMIPSAKRSPARSCTIIGRWLPTGWSSRPVRDGGIRYLGTSDARSWFLILEARWHIHCARLARSPCSSWLGHRCQSAGTRTIGGSGRSTAW